MAVLDFIFWYWWVLAAILLIIELLAPGFFFLWMAASGFITGCVVLLIPAISLNAQIVVFSVLSVIAIGVWKFYVNKHPIESDHPLLNKRGAQYIGRIFNLYEPIENGRGKIKADDTIWNVEGEDCGIESKVKVTAVKGTVFSVKKVK
jgi:membrane protein implicated in regulation of membrane protease activity